jgi:hypothetical protein
MTIAIVLADDYGRTSVKVSGLVRYLPTKPGDSSGLYLGV